MRILVCGSRDYTDRVTLEHRLNQLGIRYAQDKNHITAIIEGEARGADTLAREWAESYGIPVEKYPANWQKYGRAAGPIRNKQMLDDGKPDLVVAFPKNGDLEATKGTKNMVEQAKARNIPVLIVMEH